MTYGHTFATLRIPDDSSLFNPLSIIMILMISIIQLEMPVNKMMDFKEPNNMDIKGL